MNKQGDAAFFGRWIFSQANEARGAAAVAEQVEARTKRTAAVKQARMRERRGIPRRAAARLSMRRKGMRHD